MHTKRKVQLILVFFLISLLVSSCTPGVQPTPTYGKENEWMKYTPITVVDKIPEAFISLDEYLETHKGILEYYTFEAAIGFADADSVVLMQTVENNKSFIVEVDKLYYIDGNIAKAIAEQAQINYEKREKIYAIGEKIEIYSGYGEQQRFSSSITLKSATISDEGDSEFLTLFIDLEIDPGPTGGVSPLTFYIYHLETESGSILSETSLDGNGLITAKIPKSDPVKYIILRGNDFIVLRKVLIA
jgi:hypothetical protein